MEFLWPRSSSIIRPWLPYSIKVFFKTNQTSPNSMGLRRLICVAQPDRQTTLHFLVVIGSRDTRPPSGAPVDVRDTLARARAWRPSTAISIRTLNRPATVPCPGRERPESDSRWYFRTTIPACGSKQRRADSAGAVVGVRPRMLRFGSNAECPRAT
ncbi:hypothetical protein EVAR_13933_1 [Eumeta japonica]|uniref:Uncharacterized protein n=1 Tax=Eumeta variegata TaxID=151549 RepID=A0A4C1U8A9_EUMVA|nr:hypothetical protein EVAR_13933_1 [Eumeta japonica]